VKASTDIRGGESLPEWRVGVMDRIGVGTVEILRATRVAPRRLRSAEHVVGMGQGDPRVQSHAEIPAGQVGRRTARRDASAIMFLAMLVGVRIAELPWPGLLRCAEDAQAA
jgi:hypothetical protein